MKSRTKSYTKTSLLGSNAIRLGILATLLAFQCVAATPDSQKRTKTPAATEPAPVKAGMLTATDLPASVLEPGGSGKIKVTSTDAKGECPNGGKLISKCSGVYANGNSWEIAPCCHYETD